MIKIDRGVPPANTILDDQKEERFKEIEDLVQQGKSWDKDKFHLWKDPKVKGFLHKKQHGKCCYCEWKLHKKIDSDVEHFRPKGKVLESKKHSGYWWLVYEWDNLLMSCTNCNRIFKKTSFPLKDESKRAYKKGDDLSKEEPLLINPLKENPENFIEYDLPYDNEDCLMIKAIGKCDRGCKTVELTGINAREVAQERAELFKKFENLRRGFGEGTLKMRPLRVKNSETYEQAYKTLLHS